MAHKKGQGSVRNGRDSVSKRLGVKTYGGEAVTAGSIIIRQRGSKFVAGDGVLLGWKDGQPQHTAYALQPGTNKDPLFFNMGSTADPSIQPLSVLLGIGPPVTYFRIITRVVKPFPRPVH